MIMCPVVVAALPFAQTKFKIWFPGVTFREQVLAEWSMAKEELPLKPCFKFSFGKCIAMCHLAIVYLIYIYIYIYIYRVSRVSRVPSFLRLYSAYVFISMLYMCL